MLNTIITIYAIIDDLLRAIGHTEDCRRNMSDAEVITTALTAALFFNGNHTSCCSYMKDHNLISNMLENFNACIAVSVRVHQAIAYPCGFVAFFPVFLVQTTQQ